jgi:hypothetical protein
MPVSVKRSILKSEKRKQKKLERRQVKEQLTRKERAAHKHEKTPVFTNTFLRSVNALPFYQPSNCLLPPALYKHEWVISNLFRLSLTKRLDKLESFNISIKGAPETNYFNVLRDEIYTEFLRERTLKNRFRLIVYHWRLRKMVKNTSADLDPITFCPIETPIYVYDIKRKRQYRFEASTLIKSMTKNLYTSLYSIPEPKRPLNVITNVPFTTYQLAGIYEQLLRTRYSITDIAMYRKLGFNIEKWSLYMDSHLKVAAFRDELYNYHSWEGHRTLLDYVFDTMEYLKRPITDRFETLLTNAVQWFPEHPFLDRARAICMKAQTADIFGLNINIVMLMPFNEWLNKAQMKNELFDMVLARMMTEKKEEEDSE